MNNQQRCGLLCKHLVTTAQANRTAFQLNAGWKENDECHHADHIVGTFVLLLLELIVAMSGQEVIMQCSRAKIIRFSSPVLAC